MKNNFVGRSFKILVLFILVAGYGVSVSAQTTDFTYQGRLMDGSLPANASYDFEFTLFDAATGGTALGTTNQLLGVAVSNGIFTVVLNFPGHFDGADRWLEISVRPAGGPSFTLLNPRQPVSSAPYSIRSLNSTVADTATNADNLGGTPASEYVETTDPRMSDARTPTPGSSNYIQNQNTGTQGLANFWISGTGTANIFDAGTQFNIGGLRVLSVPGGSNVFAGLDAGTANSTGRNNSFFGINSGRANTDGTDNTFIGSFTGRRNTTGTGNAFFGNLAGGENTIGIDNTFIGNNAGAVSTASANTFVGAAAGLSNTTGQNNLFLGARAGNQNTTGSSNTLVGADAGQQNRASNSTFVGRSAGAANTTGGSNTFVGESAGLSNTTGSANSFFGIGAGRLNLIGNSNSFFGFGAGVNSTGTGNSFFGVSAGSDNSSNNNSFFGSFAGQMNTGGFLNSFFGRQSGVNNTTGILNTFVGSNAGDGNTTGNSNLALGSGTGYAAGNLSFATAIGPGTMVQASNTIQLGRGSGEELVLIPGDLQVNGDIIGNLPSGSSNYIQNQDAASQPGASFKISQTGSARDFDASTHYSIGSDRVLSNLGSGNIFVGVRAGQINGLGNDNSFVGLASGEDNTTGSDNSFVGAFAGFTNTTGGDNAFFGWGAGGANTTGSNNTIIGAGANVSLNNLTFATAIGAGATVGNNSTIVLGRSTGADHVRIPGRITVSGPVILGGVATGSGFPVCINAADLITMCPSPLADQGEEILRQRKIIEGQQKQIDGLKKLVCASNKEAPICMENEK